MVKKKKKEGRPARPLKQRIEEITFDYEKIKKLGGYGLIQSEIANVLGVSPKTLSVWKKNSEFRSILKKGKDEADAAVIASAFDKTQWKEYWEETIEYSEGKDKDGKPRVKSIRRTKKWLPPSDTAIIFWLKNRRRQDWKDVWDIEGEGAKAKQSIIIKIVEDKENGETAKNDNK